MYVRRVLESGRVVEFKVVISDPKTGKSKQVEVKGEDAKKLIGLKVGEVFEGEIVGMPGKKLKITGGSDKSGFPMRPDLPGGALRRILASGPPGFHPKEGGERKRKTVRGNTITEDIVQINTVILEE